MQNKNSDFFTASLEDAIKQYETAEMMIVSVESYLKKNMVLE